MRDNLATLFLVVSVSERRRSMLCTLSWTCSGVGALRSSLCEYRSCIVVVLCIFASQTLWLVVREFV
jgi:hypothetical protein